MGAEVTSIKPVDQSLQSLTGTSYGSQAKECRGQVGEMHLEALLSAEDCLTAKGCKSEKRVCQIKMEKKKEGGGHWGARKE